MYCLKAFKRKCVFRCCKRCLTWFTYCSLGGFYFVAQYRVFSIIYMIRHEANIIGSNNFLYIHLEYALVSALNSDQEPVTARCRAKTLSYNVRLDHELLRGIRSESVRYG